MFKPKILNAVFSRLDLVPRQEFDAQAALLAENKNKLEALQKEMLCLSQQITQLTKLKQTKTEQILL